MQIFWFEQAGADVPAADDWLSESELSRLNDLRFPKRRADWRLGRWTAKCAVAAALELPDDSRALTEIVISAVATGEPEVRIAGRAHAVTISISHRNGLAACAVALGKSALGCDLELIEPKSEAFVADYFTAEEQHLVSQAGNAAQPLLASLIWSAKESALKALHVGLRADTRSVIVDPTELHGAETPCIDWRPLRVLCPGEAEFRGWWRCTGSVLRTMVAGPSPLRPIELPLPVSAADKLHIF
jgi:4'-phosphopantetheinyl transferase